MRRRVRHTFSAGGIVLRPGIAGQEIVLVRRLVQGLWALPKGTPIGEESPAQTACREVEEETGLVVAVDRFAGSIQYQFTREAILFRKTVNFYLMHAIGGDFSYHDSEYDAVEWVSIEAALEKMTYTSEASLLRHILARQPLSPGALPAQHAATRPPSRGAERAG